MGSCEDETITMEQSLAEAENEQPELQPQVGESFMFLTVLLNHFHDKHQQRGNKQERDLFVLEGRKNDTITVFSEGTSAVFIEMNDYFFAVFQGCLSV